MEGGWNKRREETYSHSKGQIHTEDERRRFEGKSWDEERGLGEGERRGCGQRRGREQGRMEGRRERQRKFDSSGDRRRCKEKAHVSPARGQHEKDKGISGGGGGGGGGGNGGLKILYLNAQSILSKLNDLDATTCDTKPDIVLVSESWCNSSILNSGLNLAGYDLNNDLRTDRSDTTNGIGGGLLVYARKGLVILPSDKNNDFNQFLCFDVMTDNVKLHVILVYRPPSSKKANLDKLCDIISTAPSNSFIIGDFNLPSINWNNLTCDNFSNDFMNACLDSNFSQYVDFPTHSKNYVIDLVLSNDD
jgi:hypothetical protein